jgi:hypothetical protein
MLGAGCVQVVSHIDEFDAGPDGPSRPSDAPTEPSGACASGMHWTQGAATPNAVMDPGVPCIGGGCHSETSKTAMTLAGTIYPLNGPHDENNCNGMDGTGVAIALFDDNNVELPNVGRLQVNSVGNFYTSKPLPPQFHVQVIALGRPANMISVVTNGNCNYCHTQDNFMGAKGRIIPAPP